MHATYGRILGQPDDFVVCTSCAAFNWYEKDACHNCGSTGFRPVSQSDLEWIRSGLTADSTLCEECEVEV